MARKPVPAKKSGKGDSEPASPRKSRMGKREREEYEKRKMLEEQEEMLNREREELMREEEARRNSILHRIMNKIAPDFWDRNAEFSIVHANIFLYSTCFWITQNIIPYLTKELNASTVIFGYLQTTYAFVQLIGGPLFGRFGDLYGSRSALVLSFVSASISYGLLGLANTVHILFISRLPSIFMHAMQGGQMAVTDLADTRKRVSALGRLSLSYGAGMIVGPLLGGFLAEKLGLQTAAFIACAGSLISALSCQFFLPPRTKQRPPEAGDVDHEATIGNIFAFGKYYALVKRPRVFVFLLVRYITGIPIGIFQSMFAVVAMEMYGLSAQQNGFIMSYTAVLASIMQGFGMPFFNQYFGEVQMIKLGIVVLSMAYFLLMFVRGVALLCVVLVPMVFGLSVVTIVIGAALTHSVPDDDTGTILGLNMAINALIRTISPTIGAYLLENYGFSSFGFVGFVSSCAMMAYIESKFSNASLRTVGTRRGSGDTVQ